MQLPSDAKLIGSVSIDGHAVEIFARATGPRVKISGPSRARGAGGVQHRLLAALGAREGGRMRHGELIAAALDAWPTPQGRDTRRQRLCAALQRLRDRGVVQTEHVPGDCFPWVVFVGRGVKS